MRNRLTLVIGILIVLVLLSYMFMFQVRYDQVAVVTTFGKVGEGAVKTEPGLYGRWPWPIQDVKPFPTRMQVLDDPIEQRQTRDGYAVLVRSYIGWRITDPEAFYVKLGGVDEARRQLGPQLREMAAVIGRYDFSQLVNTDESQIKLREIERVSRDQINQKLQELDYGIVVDQVGLRRLLLPEAVTGKVFDRMGFTRQRMAEDARAQGTAQADAIRSQADAARRTILAFAERRAEDIRNEGRRQAAEYYKEFAKDEDFAIFLREMDALREMLKHNTTFVLDARELSPLKIFSTPQQAQSGDQNQSKPGGADAPKGIDPTILSDKR